VSVSINVLFLGDIVGRSGSRAVFVRLQTIRKKYNIDFAVANCENAADGFGITPEIANQFYSSGLDVLTSGNHIWQKREIMGMLETDPRLLRPANYPSSVQGKGFHLFDVKKSKICVINLQGRIRLSNINCPFRQAMEIVRKVKNEANCIIVDFHAEAPDEKEALAMYLDGKVSLVVGTHTHVQTADERILEGGTGYITDIGMTGPEESVIGFKPAIAIQRNLTQMPLKMEVSDTSATMQGVIVEVDCSTGKTVRIERFRENSEV
jgi:2',3'-cyclic-nucleotide 2'-phosphodiesterase